MDNRIFDYTEAAVNARIPQNILSRLVEEAQNEFPSDQMMKELHVIRAINAYSTDMVKVVKN